MYDKRILLQHIKNKQRTVQEQIDLAKREERVKASIAGRQQQNNNTPEPVKGSSTNLSDTKAKLRSHDKLGRAQVRGERLGALKSGDNEAASAIRGTPKQAGDKLKAHIMKDIGHEGQSTGEAISRIKSGLR